MEGFKNSLCNFNIGCGISGFYAEIVGLFCILFVSFNSHLDRDLITLKIEVESFKPQPIFFSQTLIKNCLEKNFEKTCFS